MNDPGGTAPIAAEYFDGRSALARPVTLALHGDGLWIRGDGVARRIALADVRWPERQRHGVRRIELTNGATLRCADAAAFDAFARAAGAADSLTVRVQQSWRLTLAAVALLVLLTAAGYRWGLPALGRAALAFVPAAVDERIGESAYQSVRAWWLQPTRVSAERQLRLQRAFERALGQAGTPQPVPRLRFHSAKRLGPNAFALPGGIVVITDELLQRLDGRDDVVLGVLAHEFGHVRHRHGMRLLVQTAVLGTVTSIALGDFSTLLAGVPALLGQLGYSRDFERDADDEAIRVLRASGISPDVMVVLFEVLARDGQRDARARSGAASAPHSGTSAPTRSRDSEPGLGIAFSSHPADHERIARFRAAAVR